MTTDPQTLLAQVPESMVRDFDTYLALRLQKALTAASAAGDFDPDQVERDLLVELFRETDGRVDPDQLGLVPSGKNEYFVPIPDSDPRTRVLPTRSGARAGRQRAAGTARPGNADIGRGQLVIAAVLVIAVLGWFGWSIYRFAVPATAATATAAPTSIADSPALTVPSDLASIEDQEDVTFGQPASLELTDTAVYRVRATVLEPGASWDSTQDAGVADWLAFTYVNGVFCLPAQDAGLLQELAQGDPITMRLANGASRAYTVQRTGSIERQATEVLAQDRAGLTILACGGSGRERTLVQATYVPPLLAQQAATVGQTQTVDGYTIRVLGVAPADGITDDPTRQIVDIRARITTTGTSDPTLLTGQLLVAGEPGLMLETVIPPAVQGISEATWRYSVPVAGGDATWDVLTPSGAQARVQFVLPAAVPPISAVLEQTGITQVITGTTRTLTVPWRLAATEAVQLTTTNLPIAATTERGPVAVVVEIYPFLSPTAPTTLRTTLVLPVDVREVVLASGGRSWRLTLP